MRVLTAAVLAVTLSASSLFAAEAPLAPGKPAGVQKAQDADTGLYWLLGLGAAGGLIILTQTGNDDAVVPAPTPPTTTP